MDRAKYGVRCHKGWATCHKGWAGLPQRVGPCARGLPARPPPLRRVPYPPVPGTPAPSRPSPHPLQPPCTPAHPLWHNARLGPSFLARRPNRRGKRGESHTQVRPTFMTTYTHGCGERPEGHRPHHRCDIAWSRPPAQDVPRSPRLQLLAAALAPGTPATCPANSPPSRNSQLPPARRGRQRALGRQEPYQAPRGTRHLPLPTAPSPCRAHGRQGPSGVPRAPQGRPQPRTSTGGARAHMRPHQGTPGHSANGPCFTLVIVCGNML